MSIRPAVEERIRSLPDKPGIYVFKGAGDRALYVGKAASLRKRALSYLAGGHEVRIAAMLEEAVDLEAIVTDTEAEALLLENNWIKRTQPRFNVLLRDDKTYPYVFLTTGDPYPRIGFTRRIGRPGREYFGPYLPGGLARKAIKLVQKLFEIRVCQIEIDGTLPRPCLYYDMRRCLGPCVDGLTSEAEYRRAVEAARLFLSGRTEELLRGLRREMAELSHALEYERAAQVRDTIVQIEAVSQRRTLSSVHGEDVDIFGIYAQGSDITVCILVMRGGQVLDRRELFWEGVGNIPSGQVLSELLPQVYDRTTFIPREIHLPIPVDGEEALTQWLSDRRGERVYLRLPARGPKAQRVALAMRNARLSHARRFRAAGGSRQAAEALKEGLDLPEVPHRIEGFDISNLQGEQVVASLVVWESGKMRKSDYRSFNIRGLESADDYESMRQAVARHYRRRLRELGDMPDLIVIDGGRGQLNAALESLSDLGVEETPVVALAKREELLFLPALPEPLRLERRHAGLLLLQQIRDEAHRFAIARHRRRRRSSSLRSELEAIRGIGGKRRRLLLQRFGSAAAVGEASLPELQELLGRELGRRVFDHCRQKASGIAHENGRD